MGARLFGTRHFQYDGRERRVDSIYRWGATNMAYVGEFLVLQETLRNSETGFSQSKQVIEIVGTFVLLILCLKSGCPRLRETDDVSINLH